MNILSEIGKIQLEPEVFRAGNCYKASKEFAKRINTTCEIWGLNGGTHKIPVITQGDSLIFCDVAYSEKGLSGKFMENAKKLENGIYYKILDKTNIDLSSPIVKYEDHLFLIEK